MKSKIKLTIAAALLAGVPAPSAAASPIADLNSISVDYARHQKITPCRFTQRQLEGARKQIGADIDTYAPGLRKAISRETKRWKDGGCKGKSRGGNLKIVVVTSRGGAGEESVTIKNAGKKAVSLGGYALRDAGDHVLKLRQTKLNGGRKLKIFTGCRSGHSSAFRRGSSYYLCRKTEIWDDAGDVVELLAPGGGLLSTKTYK